MPGGSLRISDEVEDQEGPEVVPLHEWDRKNLVPPMSGSDGDALSKVGHLLHVTPEVRSHVWL